MFGNSESREGMGKRETSLAIDRIVNMCPVTLQIKVENPQKVKKKSTLCPSYTALQPMPTGFESPSPDDCSGMFIVSLKAACITEGFYCLDKTP